MERDVRIRFSDGTEAQGRTYSHLIKRVSCDTLQTTVYVGQLGAHTAYICRRFGGKSTVWRVVREAA